MKANELRRGNFVSYYVPEKEKPVIDTIISVIPLEEYGGVDCAFLENHSPINLDALIPIPLTPELLEKCYRYDVKNGIPLKHAAYLKIIPEIKEAHVHKTENKALFILPCEFLHQFQNIYFIFSGGDELEINL